MMIHIIEDKDKTYTFYTNSPGSQEALEILYNHGIKESMEYTISTYHGRNAKKNARKGLMKTFGGEAKHLIPMIQKSLGEKDAEPIIKQIEEATTAREMMSNRSSVVPNRLRRNFAIDPKIQVD